MKESESERRRQLISLGELIALAALIVSAVGVWISWKTSDRVDDKPTTIVEQRQAIALTLRARAQDDGRSLVISPVETSHALESLTIAVPGAAPVEVGGDGVLAASDLESALAAHANESKDEAHGITVQIQARYVEAGADKRASGRYRLRYRWEGGGLFGGRSLRLVGLARA